MKAALRSALTLLTASALFGAAYAQQPGTPAQTQTSPTPARPANPTKNLPSDTGSQTTLPSGAVTGAGQPQGTGRQPDVGSPGGLERRARAADRASTTAAERSGAAGAAATVPAGDAGETAGTRRSRGARQSRG